MKIELTEKMKDTLSVKFKNGNTKELLATSLSILECREQERAKYWIQKFGFMRLKTNILL
ncbi:hypothetical protein JW868_01910 [Candidatus Woesearchaeota archaeon]|nr:hypothetical protein [Candidatus Woesearchaeota archaeon]